MNTILNIADSACVVDLIIEHSKETPHCNNFSYLANLFTMIDRITDSKISAMSLGEVKDVAKLVDSRYESSDESGKHNWLELVNKFKNILNLKHQVG